MWLNDLHFGDLGYHDSKPGHSLLLQQRTEPQRKGWADTLHDSAAHRLNESCKLQRSALM